MMRPYDRGVLLRAYLAALRYGLWPRVQEVAYGVLVGAILVGTLAGWISVLAWLARL